MVNNIKRYIRIVSNNIYLDQNMANTLSEQILYYNRL